MRRTAKQETDTVDTSTGFDLIEYAREHRYRLRNLHDGGPCPPAIWKPPPDYKPAVHGYVGQEERCDAIVGHSGYISDDGEPGMLGIFLFYKSAQGVNKAQARIKAMGGTVDQVGDTEIGGSVPVEAIEDALKLIRVSRVANRNPGGNPTWRKGTVTEASLDSESHESGPEVL